MRYIAAALVLASAVVIAAPSALAAPASGNSYTCPDYAAIHLYGGPSYLWHDLNNGVVYVIASGHNPTNYCYDASLSEYIQYGTGLALTWYLDPSMGVQYIYETGSVGTVWQAWTQQLVHSGPVCYGYALYNYGGARYGTPWLRAYVNGQPAILDKPDYNGGFGNDEVWCAPT